MSFWCVTINCTEFLQIFVQSVSECDTNILSHKNFSAHSSHFMYLCIYHSIELQFDKHTLDKCEPTVSLGSFRSHSAAAVEIHFIMWFFFMWEMHPIMQRRPTFSGVFIYKIASNSNVCMLFWCFHVQAYGVAWRTLYWWKLMLLNRHAFYQKNS